MTVVVGRCVHDRERRDTPSYGQWIADGATTLWENWGLTATNGIA